MMIGMKQRLTVRNWNDISNKMEIQVKTPDKGKCKYKWLTRMKDIWEPQIIDLKVEIE